MEYITGITASGGGWIPTFVLRSNINECGCCGKCFKITASAAAHARGGVRRRILCASRRSWAGDRSREISPQSSQRTQRLLLICFAPSTFFAVIKT